MNVLSGLFNWNSFSSPQLSTEMPELFSVPIKQSTFVEIEVQFIYAKILTDVLERTTGLTDKSKLVLFDSCSLGDGSKGLITLLAEALAKRSELFLVYKSGVDVLRVATSAEQAQIKEDYAKAAKSSVGFAFSFKNFRQSEMVEFYSLLEFLSIASLYKSANLSKAIQIKIAKLRASVGAGDATQAIAQARAVADALKAGKDVVTDVEDSITTTAPDVTAVKESIEFIDGKRSFYLGMPMSYINGILAKGLGDSGNADARAIERGLKAYYFSVIRPAVETIFGTKTTFKSEEFGQIDTAMEVLKTFELIGDKYISEENKLMVVNRLLDLDSKLGEGTEEETPRDVTPAASTPNAVPEGEKVADTAMNGAQVAALVEVVTAVNAGTLALDSAVNIIATAFNLSPEEAKRIVGSRVKAPGTAQPQVPAPPAAT